MILHLIAKIRETNLRDAMETATEFIMMVIILICVWVFALCGYGLGY
jgi:hypothetical protein